MRDRSQDKELATRYAMKYINDYDGDATDAAIKRTLGRCVVAPNPDLYPLIREAINQWRQETGQRSRTGNDHA